jgi:hypothetical protein
VMAGPVSVCSSNFSRSSRRPLRAADAERSRSREDGGDGSRSSSGATRRGRVTAAAGGRVVVRRAVSVRVTGGVRAVAGVRFRALGAVRDLLPVRRAPADFAFAFRAAAVRMADFCADFCADFRAADAADFLDPDARTREPLFGAAFRAEDFFTARAARVRVVFFRLRPAAARPAPARAVLERPARPEADVRREPPAVLRLAITHPFANVPAGYLDSYR